MDLRIYRFCPLTDAEPIRSHQEGCRSYDFGVTNLDALANFDLASF
jgi:hypothetical protein